MPPILSVALTSLALISIAACSSGSPKPPAPAPVAAAPAPPPPDMASRLQAMHDQLGITQQQQPIWNRFGQQLTSAYDQNKAMQAARAQSLSNMTVLQGMKAQQDMLSAQMSSMHQLMPTAQKLYSSMTPDQKTKWNDMMKANDSPTCGYACYILHQ